MNAVDTNVLIYSLDDDEPTKQVRATDLINLLGRADDRPILLWQVAGEFLNWLRKWEQTGKLPAGGTASHLSQIRSMFPLVMPTPKVIDKSFDLCSEYSLSHWDSMLLAACIDAGVDTLYTEDLDAETTYESVTLVNPFA